MKKDNLELTLIFPKNIIPVLFLLLSANNISAQDFELFKIGSAYYPSQSIEESSMDGEIGFFEWSAQLTIPQPLKNKKTIFIHKLLYANLRVDTEAEILGTPIDTEKYYHIITYNLGLVQTLNPKWRLTVNLTPTLASDFGESLNEDDLLFQANALVINSKSKKIKYGFGLAYTTRFGRQLVIPMGMFKYSTPKMELDIVLPNKLSVMFNTPKNTLQYGLATALNGGLFNNNSEIQTINAIIDEAGYSRLNIGPAIAVRLKKSIKINLAGGMSVGRRLEFIDVDEDTIDRTPEVGTFFRAGISFTPQKKSAETPSNN